MSTNLRIWLFAVALLLVAEDFQYILEIGFASQVKTEIHDDKQDFGEDCEKDDESNEEQKEETKKKDDKNNHKLDYLSNVYLSLTKKKFRDALSPLSDIAHDLEYPPPEM